MANPEAKKRVTVFSVILICVGLFLGFQTYRFVSSAERTQGIVQSAEQVHLQVGKHHAVVVSFRDKADKSYSFTFESRFKGNQEYWPGDSVTVIYSPDDPQGTAQVDVLTRLWLWPGVCIGAGLLFLIFRFAY